jgi:flagellar hook-basal body complex protein FliE
MSAPIAAIQSIPSIPMPAGIGSTEPSQPGLFQSVLNQSVQSVENTRMNAQASIDRFLSGEGEELHHVAVAAQGAELSFDLFMQVRNKVISAYQEVMRMQV